MTQTQDGAASQDPPPRIPIRIQSLSDLIFGLALSIGSIILVGSLPPNGLALAQNVLYFAFGFAILVLTWFGYSRTTAVLPEDAPYSVICNILLLFVVALEPYLLYVLINAKSAALANAASVAYGLDVGGMFMLQAALAYLVLRENRVGGYLTGELHPVVASRFRRVARGDFIVGLIFVASALPIFWIDTPIGWVRFYLWSSSIALVAPLFSSIGRRPSRPDRKRTLPEPS